jgi:hypothetical protein
MAHYNIASTRFKWNGILSFLVIVGSAVVGSALFVSLNSSTKHGWQHWVLASVSVAVAALAGIQRGSRLERSAEEHRQAGAKWNAVLIEVSAIRAKSHGGIPSSEVIDDIAKRIEGIVASSPPIPQSQFERFDIGQAYKCLGVDPPVIPGLFPRIIDRVRSLFRRS